MIIKSIFFDLDGTLADSVPVLRDAYTDFLSAIGVSGSTGEFEGLIGKNLSEIVHVLKNRHALAESESDLVASYRNTVDTAYTKVSARTGADELVRTLALQGYVLGLVTSAPRSLAEAFIRRQGWEALFTVNTYGDEVAAAKPDPDLYIRAIELSGDIPEEIVVVEDSVQGVAAATHAGVRTIGLASAATTVALCAAGADEVVSELRDIRGILTAWKNERYRLISANDIVLHVVPPPPAVVKKRAQSASRIEELWKEAIRVRSLHNGGLLAFYSSFYTHGHLEVCAYVSDYKEFMAGREDRAIRFGIRPVAVSGVLVVRDANEVLYVVFARRKEVTQLPGYVELVPSGGIDPVEVGTAGSVAYDKQILAELSEEVGISADLVSAVRGFVLVYDPQERVYDIGCRVELSIRKEEFQKLAKLSEEYEGLICVPYNELNEFINSNREVVVPTSLAILAAAEDHLQ